MRANLAARFWAKVDKSGGPDACWPWTAQIAYGYGRFQLNGAGELAHRVCWFLTHGAWPEECVLHECDNPPCCNPSHHFEGARGDNNADRHAKGRTVVPRLKGEQHAHAKLTTADVLAIRSMVAAGQRQYAVAADFNIGQDQVSRICNGQAWSHVA